MRNKLAAGDLLSAESILEVHREKYGEDAAWLAGLGWLARGAFLMGDLAKAGRYAADARRACIKSLDTLALEKNHDAEGPLGAVIEVEAQMLARRQGARAAAAFLRAEISAQKGSPAFMARLHKRLNLLELAGQPAPEIAVEGHLGDAPTSLASLRGKPVVLFVWAEWCGDCKAQEASLARVLKRHSDVRAIALTRWYDADSLRTRETARVDSVWSAVYSDMGAVPRVFSTASMIRYGGSATPTFVFVDRKGIVRDYTPTRLTEAELEQRIGAISR
jgi:cytochrome c biogenesis protein CcmG/thiol:disulfide interchange protein DsbE